MAPRKDLKVVIVGGSLSGLFTSAVLKSIPSVASITILERFPQGQLQDLGAGIRTGDEAVAAISTYTGTPPEKYASFLNVYKFIDRQGEVIASQTAASWVSTWGQLYRVLRENFDSDRPRCTYRHGCTLETLVEEKPGDASSVVQVTFTNESGAHETLSADLVIGADGASSRARSVLLPDVARTSVGYACTRGVVQLDELSDRARNMYTSAATFHWTPSGQLVSYAVPSADGPADESPTLINWVWYENQTADELAALLTDKAGRRHKFSLPAGGMSSDAIAAIHALARETMPTEHAEIIGKTTQPFVQIITDSISPQTSFWGGKVLLVGDAVGGQRPHTASALSQCAFHAVMTGMLVRGEIDIDHWARDTKAYSDILVTDGKVLGDICMSDMPPPERTPAYFKVFLGTQKQLKVLWDEVIQDVKARA